MGGMTMVSVTGVEPRPAVIEAGENVEVAPAGNPLTESATVAGKVAPFSGATVTV